MIRLQNLTKRFYHEGRYKTVADNLDVTFPAGVSVGLLGRNGAGKSTLLKMISGTMDPTSGRVITSGTISWQVGFAGSFHGELTGRQNTRFIARIYGVDTDELSDFVEDFSGLGKNYDMPFRTYSGGMKGRLGFGLSMGIAFDTYLIDEVTAAGDEEFRVHSSALFKARMANAGAIVVSHGMKLIRDLCQHVAVLEKGRLTYFEDVEEGIAFHLGNLAAGD